ncbi:MAG: hypothetical protein ACQGVC_18860 [Myxococcota bacterium]
MAEGSEPTATAATPEREPAETGAAWPPWGSLALYASFAALATAVYHGALYGPALFDVVIYLVSNPYTESLDGESILAILDPFGPSKFFTANYAPVHLLATALERHIFADQALGYHLVNVFVHALNGVLLVAWLRSADVDDRVAVAAGLFFLLHPANVEAVAWMSQLKTSGALAFALGALLLLRRAPLAAVVLFALSLLTKASGMFALPTAAAVLWSDRTAGRREWAWMGAWAAVAALYAIPQFDAFAHLGEVEVAAFEDPFVQLRTIAAVGARYVVMAPFAVGVSAWQEPPPATSWLDPWWLLALPLGALLLWRLVASLRARSLEGAFWLSAAASFGPVSQLFPFATPVANRYLYFILPGLLGGAILAARGPLRGAFAKPAPRYAAWAVLAVWLGLFGWQSAQRADLWQMETRLMLDAAAHYPDGATAHVLRARTAAQAGDVDGAVALLEVAVDRGIDHFSSLERDPGLQPLVGTPQFEKLIRRMAGDWIALAERRGYSTQPELRFLAIAHARRGEHAASVEALEAALAAGGPLDDTIREELARAREAAAAQRKQGVGPRR